ncbi:MAG: YbjN domain-containing protein [Selenomonadaceae bacterium]|nr:YbjN domain-containing protein [Selenomonadaceae bacterium]MBQ7630793.1 YbjN domain-containing protein [Selenomonadaceae bacterium]
MSSQAERDTLAEVRAAVENFFERDEIKHTPFDERNIASAIYSVRTKFGHVTVFFHAYEDKLVLNMIIPLSADESERAKVAEFILRANYGLRIGCFDFDFNDGEISYRVAFYCGSDEFIAPTYEQIDFSVIIGLMMIEKYGDALVKVLFGLVEPEDAIRSVEED